MLEKVKSLQTASHERLRLFEFMVCALIVLAAIGVMLVAFTTVLAHTKELVQRSTARSLYMAVEDYTARQVSEGADVRSLQNLSEQSDFIQDYFTHPIKGSLKVYVTEHGYLQQIEYTEDGKTITVPSTSGINSTGVH